MTAETSAPPSASGPPSPGIGLEWEEAPADIGAPQEEPEFFEPNLYLYDAYPGGIGFSEPLFRGRGSFAARRRAS